MIFDIGEQIKSTNTQSVGPPLFFLAEVVFLCSYLYWKMLTNAIKILVDNPFKEIFFWENGKKKTINVITFFFSFSTKVVLKLS